MGAKHPPMGTVQMGLSQVGRSYGRDLRRGRARGGGEGNCTDGIGFWAIGLWTIGTIWYKAEQKGAGG